MVLNLWLFSFDTYSGFKEIQKASTTLCMCYQVLEDPLDLSFS